MKKLLCILFIAFCTLQFVNAQKNTLYLSHQPNDVGIGIRYDRALTYNLGSYLTGSYGNYQTSCVNDHIKIAWGGIVYCEKSFITLGVSYNYYTKDTPCNLDKRVLQPVSYEVGTGTCLGNIAVAFRMDLIKGESTIEIGIKF